jgi:hypothetical protein
MPATVPPKLLLLLGARLKGGVEGEGLPPDGPVGRSQAIETALQGAEGGDIEAREASRGDQEGVGAFCLEGGGQEVFPVDEKDRAGLTLEGQAPEQAGEELRPFLAGDDVPGAVVVVGGEGDSSIGPESDEAVGVAPIPFNEA